MKVNYKFFKILIIFPIEMYAHAYINDNKQLNNI